MFRPGSWVLSRLRPARIGRTLATLALVTSPLLVSAPLLAQGGNTEHTLKLDSSYSGPAAKIESLHWLAGLWQGDSSIGTAEEMWAPPSSGTMVGAFKVVREGDTKPYFYELCEIAEVDGSLTLKVKHFSADLHGWEEKDGFVSFPLVKLGENEVFFDGLTYRRSGDELRAYVSIEHDDGKRGELEFVFERKPL